MANSGGEYMVDTSFTYGLNMVNLWSMYACLMDIWLTMDHGSSSASMVLPVAIHESQWQTMLNDTYSWQCFTMLIDRLNNGSIMGSVVVLNNQETKC